MTDNITPFTGITRLDMDPARVLEGAIKTDMATVVVIGYEADGSFYFASSVTDGGEVLWLMEVARHSLIRAAAILSEDD